MSNIRRKPTPKPTPTKPKANNTTNNNIGDIFDDKDETDEVEKIIIEASVMDDDKIKLFWKLVIVDPIKLRYDHSKQNIGLQKGQILNTKAKLESLEGIEEFIETKKDKICNMEKEEFEMVFGEEYDGELNITIHKGQEYIEVTREMIYKRRKFLEIFMKIHKTEKQKSLLSIKLGNAILTKNKQQVSLLICEFNNSLNNLVDLHNELVEFGVDYVQIHKTVSGLEMEDTNEGAYLEVSNIAKIHYDFYKLASYILNNEGYRL